MAAVSVFVDDAVRGRLPMVCAKTGEPADLVIRMQQPIGSSLRSWAWILVFFGPPGWLALLVVLMVSPAGEYLTVRVPQTDAAWSSERSLERYRLAALIGGPAMFLVGLVYAGIFRGLWLGLGGVLLLAALPLHAAISAQTIGVRLDASRRWVTLTGVHPAFVAAVEERERSATADAR